MNSRGSRVDVMKKKIILSNRIQIILEFSCDNDFFDQFDILIEISIFLTNGCFKTNFLGIVRNDILYRIHPMDTSCSDVP